MKKIENYFCETSFASKHYGSDGVFVASCRAPSSVATRDVVEYPPILPADFGGVSEGYGLTPCSARRVLIADDNHLIVKAFQKMMAIEDRGIIVDVASNGKEATARFHAHHHAVIIMDLQMPILDGKQAFMQIQSWCEAKSWQMPAVIFCTGSHEVDDLHTLTGSSKIHGVIRKPIRFQDLVHIVRSRLPILDARTC